MCELEAFLESYSSVCTSKVFKIELYFLDNLVEDHWIVADISVLDASINE